LLQLIVFSANFHQKSARICRKRNGKRKSPEFLQGKSENFMPSRRIYSPAEDKNVI